MQGQITPELIEAFGKAAVGVIAAFGAIIATVTSAVAAFYTWKNRYELDRLYATTYRPNADGTPGPMRQHPGFMVKLFAQQRGDREPEEKTVIAPPPGSPIDTDQKFPPEQKP